MSWLKRLRLSELSWGRLYGAFQRRLVDIPDALAWECSGLSNANRRRLAAFEGIRKGQRAFIIGNGPSLAKMDLSPLKNEVTFGLNRIYLHFERMPALPTYYVCINELVLEQFAEDIRALPMPKFLNWNRRDYFDFDDPSLAFVKIRYGLGDRFQGDIRQPVWGGATVTFVTLQIAFFMGFEQVILIGVDHDFSTQGAPSTVETRHAQRDADHFHPDYFPKGVRWQLPDLHRSELAYGLARQAYRADGRQVLDATVGGKCPVFEKVDFYGLFA